MNILILAAGEPAHTGQADAYPLWLSEVDGAVQLERQAKALGFADQCKFIFAFRQKDIDAYHVDAIVKQIASDTSIVRIRRETAGAACTALLAIGEIDPDAELIVASATDYVDADYEAILASFRARGADAGLLTFDSLHPRYAYVRVDEEGWVVEAAEKRPISRTANAGVYWFARARDFTDALSAMILKDAEIGGTFYICPALNELVLRDRKIATHHLDQSQYHPLKDQRQIDVLEHRLEGRTRNAT